MRKKHLGSGAASIVLMLAPLLCGGCKREVHDLSTEQLAQVVEVEQPGIKRCYDAALVSTPYRQEMRMEAVISIAPSGRVVSVNLNGGGGLPGMATCLRNTIKQWQFPKAKDSTHTSLPLVFQPKLKSPGMDFETFKQALRQAGPPSGASR